MGGIPATQQLLMPLPPSPAPQYDVMADFANLSVGGSAPTDTPAPGGGQGEGGAAAGSQQDEVVGTGVAS